MLFFLIYEGRHNVHIASNEAGLFLSIFYALQSNPLALYFSLPYLTYIQIASRADLAWLSERAGLAGQAYFLPMGGVTSNQCAVCLLP